MQLNGVMKLPKKRVHHCIGKLREQINHLDDELIQLLGHG
jgi:hypothetical protein